jgi:hypothetical protein
MNTYIDTIFWLLAAGLLGFGISAIFSGWLRLSRRIFLIPYIGMTTLFLYGFFRVMNIYLPTLLSENWIWGLIAGFLASIFLVKNVRSQPNSRQTTGGELAFDLFWLAKVGVGILALLASLFVALAYHLGYREYRNRSVGLVLIGNAVITLAYLLSASPFGALISHTLMHLAATFQGPETTLQLPPHTDSSLSV